MEIRRKWVRTLDTQQSEGGAGETCVYSDIVGNTGILVVYFPLCGRSPVSSISAEQWAGWRTELQQVKLKWTRPPCYSQSPFPFLWVQRDCSTPTWGPVISCDLWLSLDHPPMDVDSPSPSRANPISPAKLHQLALPSACWMPTLRLTLEAIWWRWQMLLAWPSYCMDNCPTDTQLPDGIYVW